MRGNEISISSFADLHEIVQLQNFNEKVKDRQQFKEAIKVRDAPKFKKAVLVSKAVKRIKGLKFTSKKKRIRGNVIHFTNVKNSFIRSQLNKSIKGIRKIRRFD